MRILTVCTSTKVFGAEMATLGLLEGLARAGHEQLAVTSTWTDGDFNERLARIGVSERRLPFGAISKLLRPQPMWWTANTLIRLPWLWIGWLRIIAQFKPDVVLFTSSRLAVLVFPWLTQQPSFLVEHSYVDATPIRYKMYRFLARRLTAFIAVSRFMGEHFSQFGVPASKIQVVCNGLLREPQFATSNRSIAPLSVHRAARIGIVGQIIPIKGHDVLIEALRILRDRGKAAEVYAFGSGNVEFISVLSSKLEKYGLTDLWFWRGYESNVEKIYQDLDICVMPSSNESFGLVATEASAYELPVLVSNRGGLREIVDDGVTGFLIDPEDPNDLSDKITWLLDNPVAARRLGVEGRKKVLRDFTQERMVAGYESLFRESLSNA